jgi:hypothetical protein
MHACRQANMALSAARPNSIPVAWSISEYQTMIVTATLCYDPEPERDQEPIQLIGLRPVSLMRMRMRMQLAADNYSE